VHFHAFLPGLVHREEKPPYRIDILLTEDASMWNKRSNKYRDQQTLTRYACPGTICGVSAS
jgi:hypothetical protein